MNCGRRIKKNIECGSVLQVLVCMCVHWQNTQQSQHMQTCASTPITECKTLSKRVYFYQFSPFSTFHSQRSSAMRRWKETHVNEDIIFAVEYGVFGSDATNWFTSTIAPTTTPILTLSTTQKWRKNEFSFVEIVLLSMTMEIDAFISLFPGQLMVSNAAHS